MKVFVTGTRGIPGVMGGVETHCEQLYPRLVVLGHEVTVARRRNYVQNGERQWHGVALMDLPAPKKKSFEAITHTLLAILQARKKQADVVHIHAIGPALLTPLARLLGMKVVFTHHGEDYLRNKWWWGAKLALRLGERLGTSYANEVIAISHSIHNHIVAKYGRQDCHLIYNGVSTPELVDHPEYFEELGLKPGAYILSVTRFAPEKNLHHLIEAFAGLAGNKSTGEEGVKLVLAGDTDFEDDYSRRLKQTAREGGVVLTGFVKGRKLHSLLTHARAYCLPSSHEGLPIALLEAMSYRLPVVVSDIPANLEVGLPKECYFTCGDVGELRQKLKTVMEEHPKRVDYDMAKYDWDSIARQVDKVYQNLEGTRQERAKH